MVSSPVMSASMPPQLQVMVSSAIMSWHVLMVPELLSCYVADAQQY